MLSRVQDFTRRHAGPLRWVALGVALLAVVLFTRALPLERPLEWLRGQVETLGPWGPAVFVLAFFVLTGVLLPGWPLNVLAGAVYGPWWGGALTSLASTAAAGAPFLIGRYLARDWIVGTIQKYPRFDAVYRAIGAEASWKVVAGVRLSHALPFGLQNYLLGVTPVRFLPFLLTTWAVTLPGIFFVAYLGHLGAAVLGGDETPATGWSWAARGAGLLVAAGAIFYFGRLVRRALKEHGSAGPAPDSPPADGATRPGWPWLTLAALGGAALLMAAAAWSYFERERVREVVEGWFA